MAKFKAVILAGGSGERFWPLSTSERPKQFLDIFGGESLLRQTVARLDELVSPRDVYVVTSRALAPATRRALPELPRANIAGEPERRDTAAAVALGTGLAAEDDDTILGFFPSDHCVSKPGAFRAAVRKAIAIAARERAIVVIGIKPSEPSTAYGYVEPKTGKFVEKPDYATAKRYLKKGYMWNAGMFIARAGVFRAAFGMAAPALSTLAAGATGRLAAIYASLPRISFDNAVMEKFSMADGFRVALVKGDFGWDDVGGFAAAERHFSPDADGNFVLGECARIGAAGNICIAPGMKVALLGVNDLVVAATPHGVLVAAKSSLGDMKKIGPVFESCARGVAFGKIRAKQNYNQRRKRDGFHQEEKAQKNVEA